MSESDLKSWSNRGLGYCEKHINDGKCQRLKNDCYQKKAEEIIFDPDKTDEQKRIELGKNMEDARRDSCDKVNRSEFYKDFVNK